MKLLSAAKLGFAIALSGLIVGLAAPPAVARPKPPPIIEAPPPPPPPPDVGFGSRFVDDAAVYQGYMAQSGAISPAFADAQGVADALRTGVAYEPGQLRRGAVTYAAIAALEDAAFVADVRKAGATPEGRYAIIARIFADPRNALAFSNSHTAAGLAKAALATTGMGLFSNGERMRLAAYAIQHQPWSLADVAGRDARASAVKTLSATPRRPTSEAHANIDRLIGGDVPAAAPQVAPPPYSPLVIHAVALAALAAIGQASADDAGHLGWLSDDYYLDHCLAEAKLSLYECLAVAKPNYEDVFCLGQHAMKDTGACVVKSAWSTVPIDVTTHDLVITTPHAHRTAHAAHRRRA